MPLESGQIIPISSLKRKPVTVLPSEFEDFIAGEK